jgi:hypothetical protein
VRSFGQTVTGTISGIVIDSSGAVIPGAKVTVTNEATSNSRTADSGGAGEFVITALPPGTYTVKAEKGGLQNYERTSNVLTANQWLALGNITLAVGTTTQTTTVTAQGEAVNTESASQSALVSTKQLSELMVRGRDVVNILKTMPGVNQIITSGSSEVAESGVSGTGSPGGVNGSYTPSISGYRSYWNNVSIDGQPADNQGIRGVVDDVTSMDHLAEVKIIVNNYEAQYGRNPGPTIAFISKTGTSQFHGGAYYYFRNEDLNANTFISNRNSLPRPLYRYNTVGITVGGPAYIPKVFNTSRNKLFFFFGSERWRINIPGSLIQQTVPTALERTGNFSQTIDQNGRLVPITDPANGSPFPGNTVPASRVDANGKGILNVFPLPNMSNLVVTKGAYNYQYQQTFWQDKQMDLLRLDYVVTPKDTITIRGKRWYVEQVGYGVIATFSGVPLIHCDNFFGRDTVNVGYTHLFGASMVNELNAGIRPHQEGGRPDLPDGFAPVQRQTYGITLGQFYPQNNPYNLIPAATFSGVPSATSIAYDYRFPKNAQMNAVTVSDNFSYSKASHLFKFGFLYDREYSRVGLNSASAPSGSIDFGTDPNNPGNTGWAFANAILGNYRSYTEPSSRPEGQLRNFSVEWFAQDTWKITRRLTLTYGLRMSHVSPWVFGPASRGQAAVLETSLFSAAQIPAMFTPVLNSSGSRVAANPLTGQLYPAVYIGGFVPGSGNPTNGTITDVTPNYPPGFVEFPAVDLSPRFGFAYDPFGDGKTAIRGGAGVMKETQPTGNIYLANARFAPPAEYNPSIFYGSLNTLLGSTGILFPSNTYAFERHPTVPTVYNYSLTVQRYLGASTLLDAGYVGNLGRHLIQSQDSNLLPYGTRFQARSLDPTTGKALPDNFLRTYGGYGSITYLFNGGESNYNSLQVSATRRFASGVIFGLSYTYSKTMDLSDDDSATGVSTFISRRVWNYAVAGFDQTHMLAINYVVPFPRASKLLHNHFVRVALDDWSLSGFTTAASGLPQPINLTTTNNADITGGGDGSRVVMLSSPSGPQTFTQWFNAKAFGLPATGTFGNAPRNVFRGPGINNFDLSLAKKFALGKETRNLQFRWETFNSFNHTQYASVDNTARFDPSGNQTNGQFGQVTGVRPARVMQFSLRVEF